MKKFFLLFLSLSLFLFGCSSQESSTNSLTDNPFKGNESAKVVIEEFGDFECPACKSAAASAKMITDEFGEEVKLVWYHFPLEQIHRGALPAALASECAKEQGKFWEYHDILYEKQKTYTKEDLIAYARTISLDEEQFNGCLQSKKYLSDIRSDQRHGNKLRIGGTPSFFINGKPLPSWRHEVFRSMVQSEIQKNR